MEINTSNLITLNDNNRYYVGAATVINNIKYLYLIDESNVENMKICRQEVENGRIKLTVVKNDAEFRKVIPLLYKDAKKNCENA